VIIFAAFTSPFCYESLQHHPLKKMAKGHFGNTLAATDIASHVKQV
jgi:hypothetical protein